MIPRFSNPHFLNLPTKNVSRAEIDSFYSADTETAPDENVTLGKRLRDLVHASLGDLNSPDLEASHGKRKRRRIEDDINAHGVEDSLPFRLVSTSLPPKPVSLDPKPLPATKFREPECEDNEAEASLRARQAESVAVDVAWLISESKKPCCAPRNTHKKLIHAKAALLDSSPVICIMERSKSLARATRPPVSPSDLASPLSLGNGVPQSVVSRGMDCPNISIEVHCTAPRMKRVSRDVGGPIYKPRPKLQPVFWRPSPAMQGKSRGYAMGYPGSWAAYNDDNPNRRWYQRDTTKKAVHTDSLWL